MTKRSIVSFLAALLLVSWTAQCVLIYYFRDLESDEATLWLVGLMFFPALAALIYRLVCNRDAFRHITFRPGNAAYLFLAAWIPAATAFAVLAVVILMGWGRCDFFSFSPSGVDVARGPWLLGLGAQSWLIFAANIALTALAYAALNSVAAIGEEFAWRGFLQKHMIDRFGLVRGVALLGLVWAYWHLPAILSGYNYPDTPILGGLVLFPLVLTAESFVMAWLTLRARSFWPAVVMHGSINGIQEGILSHLTFNQGAHQLYADLTEAAVASALGLVCLLLLLRRPAAQPPGQSFTRFINAPDPQAQVRQTK